LTYIVICLVHPSNEKDLYIVKEKDNYAFFSELGGIYESQDKVRSEGGYVFNEPSITLHVTEEEFADWENKRNQILSDTEGIKQYI
jgi:hypothetical protein